MAAMDQLQFFLAQKINGGNYSNFTITFPTIWRCAGDFFKVLRKFKMAAMDELHNFLLKSEIFHITIWKCAGDFGHHKSTFYPPPVGEGRF